MDPVDLVLHNARETLGCNGLRNLFDLAQMRQETLEKRLTASARRLSSQNMASIYSAWLSERICIGKPIENCPAVVEKMCCLLWRAGCQAKLVLNVWLDCVEGNSRLTWQTPFLKAALHSIGETIFRSFPNGANGLPTTSLHQAVRSAERLPLKTRDRSRSRSPRKTSYDPRSSRDSYRPRRSPRPPLSRPLVQTKCVGSLNTSSSNTDQQGGKPVIKAEPVNDIIPLSGLPFVGRDHNQLGRLSPKNMPSSIRENESSTASLPLQIHAPRPMAAGKQTTQQQRPKSPAQTLWATFGEASASNESPFSFIAKKNALIDKAPKTAVGGGYKAPVAAMGPDLMAGSSSFVGSQMSSMAKLNEGRLSPWEEDAIDSQLPPKGAYYPYPLSTAEAFEFLDSLVQGTSSNTSSLPEAASRLPASDTPQTQASYRGSWIGESRSSCSSVASFSSTPISDNFRSATARPNYYQMQNIELGTTHKPLIGYDPVVERLFRSRENLWVHHMKRKAALDYWAGQDSPDSS